MTLALRRNLLALHADLDAVSFEGSTPFAPAEIAEELRSLDKVVISVT